MKRIAFLLISVATLSSVVAFPSKGSRLRLIDQEAAPSLVTEIPPGYRDWQFHPGAHGEGHLNRFGADLGNDVAGNADHPGKRPFPGGAIVAELDYRFVPFDGNNKVFGRSQSFVAGTPT